MRLAEFEREIDGRLLDESILKNFMELAVTSEDGRIEAIRGHDWRFDLYIPKVNRNIMITSFLDEVTNSEGFDPSHCSYSLIFQVATGVGSPPGKHTVYASVSRLGYRQIATIEHGIISVSEANDVYSDLDTLKSLHCVQSEYSTLLMNGVSKAVLNGNSNILFSSGWDSTALLACLIANNVQRDRINPILLKMKVGEGRYFNEHEMIKARAFAEYYGVTLNEIDIDYNSPELLDFYIDRKDYFRKNMLGALPALNHLYLIERGGVYFDRDAPVINGEMSDGLHNLGFAQNITLFHENSFAFREYSDKMMCYLFSPSFLNFCRNNPPERDTVWGFLLSELGLVKARSPLNGLRELLTALFCSKVRFPYADRAKIHDLSLEIQNYVESITFNEYFSAPLSSYNGKNLYSIYRRLYEDFHWQGATVRSLDLACAKFGFSAEFPFHNLDLVRLVESTPESYGRGLELKPTKYLLKEMLRQELKYPVELRDGPHSYIYDTERGAKLEKYICNGPLAKHLHRRAVSIADFIGKRPNVAEKSFEFLVRAENINMNLTLALYDEEN